MLVVMGRGLKGATVEARGIQIRALSASQSTANACSVRSSTAQRDYFSSPQVFSTFHDGIYHEEKPPTHASRFSHLSEGTSPQWNLAHARLLEVESRQLNDSEGVPYRAAKGIMMAFCILWGFDAKL